MSSQTLINSMAGMSQRRNFRSDDGRLQLSSVSLGLSRQAVVGLILVVALLAFELFNFDTTRYALQNLLGEVRFAGLAWATILAVAFCAIDFAGLVRFFTPPSRQEQPKKEMAYLFGAWFLGATMNAIMTWWAVSLTLLNHDFGNEVLGRDTLLAAVPVFLAALVLLTRILFIGAFTVAGVRLFDVSADEPAARPSRFAAEMETLDDVELPETDEVPAFLGQRPPAARYQPTPTAVVQPSPALEQTKVALRPEPAVEPPTRVERSTPPQANGRVKQRPPVFPNVVRPVAMEAKRRN
ncbi:MAG: hypothetical protein AB1791_18370 [Chloroflexota bacterium]